MPYQSLCTGATTCSQSQAVDAVIDPVRYQLWLIGTSTNVSGQIGSLTFLWIDLTGSDSYATHDVAASVTGCSSANVQYPGLAYDPARGFITIYPNSGNTVVSFNPTTGQCVNQTFSGGPPASAYATSNGINNRFAFFPAIGKYAIVTGVDVDWFTFTLDHDATYNLGSSTLYCVDRDGDGYGTGPVQLGPYMDLTVNASNNLAVSSVSYSFVPALDTGRHIAITAGTGWTTGDYAITCIGANCTPGITAGSAQLDRSPAATGTTGGSWNSPGCLGPDADDLDATVHTGTQAITKWGSVTGWLNHLGYNPTRIWYVSPSGNDSTCAVNNAALPCATYAHIRASQAAGDAVVARDQYNDYVNSISGSYGNPLFYFSYPGEVARMFPPTVTGAKFVLGDVSNIVIDGWGLNGGAAITGGTTDTQSSSTTSYRVIKHVIAEQDDGLAPINGFNGIIDWVVEDNYLENQDSTGTPHGIYIGMRTMPFTNQRISLRRNIFHNSSYNSIHLNGRFSNLWAEANLAWNAGIANFSLQQGISNSYFISNIAFGATRPLDKDDYPGSIGGSNCGSGQTSTCTCPGSASHPGTANLYAICPYNQTGNLWENNTFYNTGTNPCANRFCTAYSNGSNGGSWNSATVGFQNTSDVAVQLGGDTFRNNIFVNYGNNNAAPPIEFTDNGGSTCSGPSGTNTTCLGWALNDTFDHNIFFQADGNAGSGMLGLGTNVYTCSSSLSPTQFLGSNTSCSTSNPNFVSASPAYWNTPASFNFKLAPGSPASHAGINPAPVFDNIGTSFVPATPSIGALEVNSASTGRPAIVSGSMLCSGCRF
jgi:hypothetical protein